MQNSLLQLFNFNPTGLKPLIKKKAMDIFKKTNAPLNFNKKVLGQLKMSMEIAGNKGGYSMVRNAKKDVIRPSDLEIAKIDFANHEDNKRSDIEDPILKKLIDEYQKSIENGYKDKILEKIIFEDGSCYYVVKGLDF
jgi:hypothetical protein